MPFGVDEAGQPKPVGESVGEQVDAAAREAEEAGRTERPMPVAHDVGRARRLLAEAGYPGGANFPRIRLVINRNEQQRIVAQEIARTWRSALGVETDVVVRNWEEYEALVKAGDFDVARKSVVMQSVDEESNMLALFGEDHPVPEETPTHLAETPAPDTANESSTAGQSPGATNTPPAARSLAPPTRTEAQALRELRAVPIYFASSYALVKPYVNGFETNLLDAPSLKNVSLDTSWKPPEPRTLRVASVEKR